MANTEAFTIIDYNWLLITQTVMKIICGVFFYIVCMHVSDMASVSDT